MTFIQDGSKWKHVLPVWNIKNSLSTISLDSLKHRYLLLKHLKNNISWYIKWTGMANILQRMSELGSHAAFFKSTDYWMGFESGLLVEFCFTKGGNIWLTSTDLKMMFNFNDRTQWNAKLLFCIRIFCLLPIRHVQTECYAKLSSSPQWLEKLGAFLF